MLNQHDMSILDGLDPRDREIILTLERAGMNCRVWEGEEHCEELADAFRKLYMHACTLDGKNLSAWNKPFTTLMALYGQATHQRKDFICEDYLIEDMPGVTLVMVEE